MYRIFIILLIFTNILFSQHYMTTKEYHIYVTNETETINMMNLIDEIEGTFEVALIKINDITYERNKKIMMQKCELDFNIISELSLDPINYKLCKNKIFNKSILLVSNEKPSITIDRGHFKSIVGTFIFRVTGNYLLPYGCDSSSSTLNNNGILREWYPNGNLYIEYTMKDGIKDGICKRWYDNFQIDILYNYSRGKLHGRQLKWYKNGSKRAEWNYIDDVMHGISKEWSNSGSLISIKSYENGVLITEDLF